MKHDTFNCLVCKKNFNRRLKGMKDRAYKKSLRPYRSLTCSTRCSVLYTRMPLNKRRLIKIQGGIMEMEKIQEVLLGEDFILDAWDDEDEGFGFALQSEEKHNSDAPKDSPEEYYHNVICMRTFKKRENFEEFKKGMKLMSDAIYNEIELEEDE